MYVIQDWAGNILYKHGEFNSFESCWDYIFENFKEDDLQDLFVVNKSFINNL